MFEGLLTIDADAHKMEKPLIMRDYLDCGYRDRISLIIDSLDDQRARIVDVNPATGENDLVCLFPQPGGLGKGGFRVLHAGRPSVQFSTAAAWSTWTVKGSIHVIFATFGLCFACLVDSHAGLYEHCDIRHRDPNGVFRARTDLRYFRVRRSRTVIPPHGHGICRASRATTVTGTGCCATV